ncbi:MAG: copper-translocating P-type ATPase, partial [Deltaproteobacteria bacterium]|nr:copper-translocating P-type ATPase [Deltaproteobacteria bacterium]
DTRSGGARLAAIEQVTREDTEGLRRDATIAIALTVPLLALAMAHGAADRLVGSTANVIVQLVLGTLVVLGPGRRYLRAGWVAVRHRSPDMNTLIALGAGAAWLSSVVAAVRWLGGERHHLPPLYFEAGAAIVAFVMIGKLLEARARSRLADAVRGLMSLAPTIARRIAPGGSGVITDIDVAALVAGDSILVRPGERLPADGTIVEGRSALDESMLTGESLPVDKTEGSPVYAGTLNHHGALTIRVARAGGDTALARIARAVEDAQGGKAPIARLADRVSAWFVPVVLAIAALTFLIWLLAGAGTDAALERMIAVLVVACPCALGLATPAAVAVGSARGAELGILFRTGGALETGSAIEIVALDKTGTLTANRPTVVAVRAIGVTEDELVRIAASAEQGSEHPVARAIVAVADGVKLSPATEVTADPGAGVRALIDGSRVVIGTRESLELAGVALASVPLTGGRLAQSVLPGIALGQFVRTELEPRSHEGHEADGENVVGRTRAAETSAAQPPKTSASWSWCLRGSESGTRAFADGPSHEGPSHDGPSLDGASLAYVAIDGALAGVIAIADPIAPEARATIDALRAAGIEPVMITGDRAEVANAIAAELGITRVHADVRPTGKAALVGELRTGGKRVAMVGDGINDAPALAAADLGIALGSGTDIAAAAADVTLLRGGISALPTALALARATLHTIRRNLVAAFAYNVVCIPIAAGALYPVTGWQLSPVLASAVMSLSSVSVLVSSLRLRTWSPRSD